MLQLKKTIRRTVLTTGIGLLLSLQATGQDSIAKVEFLFVGDIMQHGGQIAGAYNAAKDSYDYHDCFQFVKPIVQQADIAIANLEVTHAGKPYKGYPQFSAPPELSEALIDAGFNVIINANNHSCDGGAKGVLNTLDALDRLHVQHTGTFRNQAERDQYYPLLVEKNGLKVAVLNYTYGTNGLSVAPPLIINYIDSAVMKADFKKAREMNVDWIVCTLHWGTEYQSLPNDDQKRWEQFCYDNGADMVIGGHPHVLQPVVTKMIDGKQKLTAWSLGNFVSNQRDRYKDGGMILHATVEKNKQVTKLTQVQHQFTWVYPRQEKVNKPFYILPEFNYSAYRPDFMPVEVYRSYQQFFEDARALFQVHATGTAERTVTDALVVQRYEYLLKGYFAFEFQEPITPESPFFKAADQATIHKVLGADGNYHYLLGYYGSILEADQQLLSVNELFYKAPQLVFITPNEYKKVR